MAVETLIPMKVFWGFLLALGRIGGIFVFLPLPGSQGITDVASHCLCARVDRDAVPILAGGPGGSPHLPSAVGVDVRRGRSWGSRPA